MQAVRKLILTAQVLSIAATVLITTLGVGPQLLPARVESLGGTLSTLLIMLGIICHIGVKRGTPHAGLLVLLCCFGPVYAYIGGIPRYVFGFHAVALGFHVLVLKVMADKARSEAERAAENPDDTL